jgi:hypothetical protein
MLIPILSNNLPGNPPYFVARLPSLDLSLVPPLELTQRTAINICLQFQAGLAEIFDEVVAHRVSLARVVFECPWRRK